MEREIRSIRVVMVDDEDDLRDVLSEFLENHDINVVGKASNGNEAIQLYRDLKPDLVLLDLQMSTSSGFYALEKIRKINSNAKVIVVTGVSSYDVAEDAKSLGALAVVHKTEELNNLPKIIEKACHPRYSFNIFKKKKTIQDI